MNDTGANQINAALEELYNSESRRILATLIRLLGDFDLAEDALQEAFAIAAIKWQKEGIPKNPRSWLVSTGRFKAIDNLRRKSKFTSTIPTQLENHIDQNQHDPADQLDDILEDDQLRLIFTCCHFALSEEARAALTLREVCDLSTDEIARAYLTSNATVAQRIVRAKSKIRKAGIPYQIPPPEKLPERLDTVLQVIYLIFNEGYSSTSGESLTRRDLCDEAIRLGRLLMDLLPESEVSGLLGLMLLQDSRRETRMTAEGDLVLLEDQDRSLWDKEKIKEGSALIEQSLLSRRFESYTIQGAIAAVHAEAPDAQSTDWAQIEELYSVLQSINPSPVVELNMAVATAMHKGIEAGLEKVNAILDRGDLENYYLVHSTKADFFRRLGKYDKAKESYQRALSLTQQGPEQRFLEKRLKNLK